MEIDIIRLYRECPEATLTVKVSDLIEANRSLVAEAIQNYEEVHKQVEMNDLLTGQEVEQYLGISRATRERWGKPDAFGQPPMLPKIKVGWLVRYKKADVENVKVKLDYKHEMRDSYGSY
jgi:predicted DNA-binding transcriptional regulator AlpA